MNIKIKGVLFNSPDNIEILPISVHEENSKLVRKKLEFEKTKMINYLKYLKEINQIKSISKPSNKSPQYQLDKIVNSKKICNKSIQTIKTVF